MERLSILLFGEKKEFTFYSRLSIDECLRRLKSATIKPPAWKEEGILSDPKIVVGEFNGSDFQLKKRTVSRSPYPVFYGSVANESSGTKISGYFDIEPATKFFGTLGLIMLSGFLIVFILNAITALINRRIDMPLIPFFGPLVAVCFALIAIKLTAEQMKKERGNLLVFLKNSLEASSEVFETKTTDISNKNNK